MAVPFYILVERPFKNFLDLILFPRSSIFLKQKDIDDEENSSDEDDDTAEETRRIGKAIEKIHCGYCQGDQECECYCLVSKKICKCINNIVKKQHSMVISSSERSQFMQRLKQDNEKLKEDVNMVTEESESPDRNKIGDSLIRSNISRTNMSTDKKVSFNFGVR